MSFVNADIPVFEAYVRDEFLYDMQKGFGEHTPVAVFGVSIILLIYLIIYET